MENEQKKFEYGLGIVICFVLIGVVAGLVLSGVVALLGLVVVNIANGGPGALTCLVLIFWLTLFAASIIAAGKR